MNANVMNVEFLKNIQSVIDLNKCTGCMACAESCPAGAISYATSHDSFRYPKIDENKCIRCGKCLQSCTGFYNENPIQNTICYAIQANDDDRKNSSSGGFFSVISRYYLENDGVVCGAAFINGKVKHILIDSIKKIDLLKRSKYIQSDCHECYPKIKNVLAKGKKVLFVGTPCQCSAVKRLFPFEEQLLVIDILCMGVPSQALFDKYMAEEFHNNIPTDINFRNKTKYGWNQNLVLEILFGDKRFLIDNTQSSYYGAFLNGYSIRNSCTSCEYAGKKRVGDITIGDFWEIESIDPHFDDHIGTSLVLINSPKGNALYKEIHSRLKKVKDFDINIAYKINPILKFPTIVSSKQREFVKNIYNKSLKENFTHLKNNTADCGIINYWWCNDNGAILTAFALQKLLDEMGYSSRLINVCPENQLKQRSRGISSQFEKKYLFSTEQIITDEQFKALNNSFKHFIVGSDQVFRAEWVSNRYFLDFVSLEKNKIAMSASFGKSELGVPKTREWEIIYYLSRFNSVSIRELSGISLCNQIGIKSEYVIDPVFLINTNIYIDLINDTNEAVREKSYLFAYFRDPSEFKKKATYKLASEYNIDVFVADDNTPVEIFLKRIYNSFLVITDSYHGLCFSIIFNKNYVCYKNKLRGNDRLDTLVSVLKIPEQKFANENDLDVSQQLNAKIDWSLVNSEIANQRTRGQKWLNNALNNPPGVDKRKIKKSFIPVLIPWVLHRIKRKLFHNRIALYIKKIVEEKET